MWLLLFCYISPGTIYESDDSKTDPNLNSNPNPNGHRKPYTDYMKLESLKLTRTLTVTLSLNPKTNPNHIPKP